MFNSCPMFFLLFSCAYTVRSLCGLDGLLLDWPVHSFSSSFSRSHNGCREEWEREKKCQQSSWLLVLERIFDLRREKERGKWERRKSGEELLLKRDSAPPATLTYYASDPFYVSKCVWKGEPHTVETIGGNWLTDYSFICPNLGPAPCIEFRRLRKKRTKSTLHDLCIQQSLAHSFSLFFSFLYSYSHISLSFSL